MCSMNWLHLSLNIKVSCPIFERYILSNFGNLSTFAFGVKFSSYVEEVNKNMPNCFEINLFILSFY